MAKAIMIQPKIQICSVYFQGPFSKPEQLPVESTLLVVLDVVADSFRLMDVAWCKDPRKVTSDSKTSWLWRKQCRGCAMFAYLPALFQNRSDELCANILYDQIRGKLEGAK